jgi:hypothetical protein
MATPQLGIFLSETQTASQSSVATGISGSGQPLGDQFSSVLGQYMHSLQGIGSPGEGIDLPPGMDSLVDGNELPEGFLAELESRLNALFGELGDLESMTQEQLQQAFDSIADEVLQVASEFNISVASGFITGWLQGLAPPVSGDGVNDGTLPAFTALKGQFSGFPENTQSLAVAPPRIQDALQQLKDTLESQNFSNGSVTDGLKSILSNTAATSMAVSFEDFTSVQPQVASQLYSPAQQTVVEEAEVSLQRIPVPPGHRQFTQELSERIMVMSSKNVQMAEIQLTPPELGSLMVKINVDNDQASVVFTSPNSSVREALEQQSFRLREMLEEQGMDLVDVDVSDQNQGEPETEEMIAEGGNRRNDEDDQDAETFLDSLDQQKAMTASMRLVDYYA